MQDDILLLIYYLGQSASSRASTWPVLPSGPCSTGQETRVRALPATKYIPTNYALGDQEKDILSPLGDKL